MMTTILSLETATNACSAAIVHQGVVTSRFEIAPREHSHLILQMIDALRSEANIAISDLDAITFGCGPGSFMGVRLAIGIAQGLAFAANCPVIPLSTLQCLAQTAFIQTKASTVLVGWDARMQDVYWGLYAESNGLMQPRMKDTLAKPNTVTVNESVTAIGNAWSVYQDQLNPALSNQCIATFPDIYPDAAALLPIALHCYQTQSKELMSPEFAAAHYCRDQVVHTK
jgi:tRNA threonylcarbamoyladenosine biosynthesis protein TsaB